MKKNTINITLVAALAAGAFFIIGVTIGFVVSEKKNKKRNGSKDDNLPPGKNFSILVEKPTENRDSDKEDNEHSRERADIELKVSEDGKDLEGVISKVVKEHIPPSVDKEELKKELIVEILEEIRKHEEERKLFQTENEPTDSSRESDSIETAEPESTKGGNPPHPNKLPWPDEEKTLRSMLMHLHQPNRDGMPFMDKGDIEEFMKNNFGCFEDEPTGRVFNVRVKSKTTLRYFFYQFYNRNYYNEDSAFKMKFIRMLIRNFKCLINDKEESFYDNFSRPPSSKQEKIKF